MKVKFRLNAFAMSPRRVYSVSAGHPIERYRLSHAFIRRGFNGEHSRGGLTNDIYESLRSLCFNNLKKFGKIEHFDIFVNRMSSLVQTDNKTPPWL